MMIVPLRNNPIGIADFDTLNDDRPSYVRQVAGVGVLKR